MTYLHRTTAPARRRRTLSTWTCLMVMSFMGLTSAAQAASGATVSAPPSRAPQESMQPLAPQSTGPKLRVSARQAAAAMTCHGSLAASRNKPVLFLHGTHSSARGNWSWNWNKALRQRQWAYCSVDLPANASGDIQVAAEYVVHAIRTMRERRGGPISIVGHSQGGMVGRWALKFWPDLRPMVDDYVGLASSNHGSQLFNLTCTLPCSAAQWQQRRGSEFLAVLNRGGQTFKSVDYTEISTRLDEIVVPSTSPYLPRGRNVTNTSVQDLCPVEVVEHFGMAYSNAAWLIGLDALTHDGPAEPSRISASTCGRPFMPGVDVTTALFDIAAALTEVAGSLLTAKMLPAEPALRGYTRS